MENHTFVHIQGTRKHYSCVGSYYKDEVSFTTYLDDYALKITERDAKNGKDFWMGGVAVLDDGDYNLFGIHAGKFQWRLATDDEIARFHKVLKDHNLEMRMFTINNSTNIHPFWIDKDKMPVILNGKPMTLGELLKTDINGNVVLSWDNGYSHWGSETAESNAILKRVENMFGESRPHEVNNGKALCGEHYGWHYDRHGAWELSITNKTFSESFTSNT